MSNHMIEEIDSVAAEQIHSAVSWGTVDANGTHLTDIIESVNELSKMANTKWEKEFYVTKGRVALAVEELNKIIKTATHIKSKLS